MLFDGDEEDEDTANQQAADNLAGELQGIIANGGGGGGGGGGRAGQPVVELRVRDMRLRELVLQHGMAVQADPIKPTLKASETKRFKLRHVKLLSSFAFKFNLRRYSTVARRSCGTRRATRSGGSPVAAAAVPEPAAAAAAAAAVTSVGES